MALNDAICGKHEDPWTGEDHHDERRQSAFEFWNKIPEENRAWLEVIGIVPFENILDIDDLGDEYVQAPHVYVPFGGWPSWSFRRFFSA